VTEKYRDIYSTDLFTARAKKSHVIDDDFNHNGSVVSASILLKAGLHPIRVFYRHGAGSLKLEMEYAGPGISRQPVPASAFFAADGAAMLDTAAAGKGVSGAPAAPKSAGSASP